MEPAGESVSDITMISVRLTIVSSSFRTMTQWPTTSTADPDAETDITQWQLTRHKPSAGPALSYDDQCRHRFEKVFGASDSAICQYPARSGVLYVAGVGKPGNRRVGVVHLPAPAAFQVVAVAFVTQHNDPVLTRAVWGHGRVIHEGSELLISRLESVPDEATLSDGTVIPYDRVTTGDSHGWLPRHQALEAALDKVIDKPQLQHLIRALTSDVVTAMQNSVVEYICAIIGALRKIPSVESKQVYLEHHRTSLNTLAYVDWSVMRGVLWKDYRSSGCASRKDLPRF
ncbi:hypothetical protein B0H10DRAFT_294816 [Mycena sp. CBHHK59/15]|nr:hypothetical protein B0H10DRAFT_294816 [Mycena sp. CBHHK59/15]